MKRMKTTTLLILSALLMLSITEVDAARMGSGKSFGSKPSYSQSYRAPSAAERPSAAPQQAATPAMARNQAARESMSRRGGLMGMLGGLALGGLLGAMLFGGAFEHINFMDIAILALVAFVLYKLFASRRTGQSATAASSAMYRQPYTDEHQGNAGFETDVLSSRNRAADTTQSVRSEVLTLPADFDKSAFLSGAKAAYVLLQQAWDSGQLSEIRALTTDKVFAELQDQFRAREGINRTELVKIELKLISVADVGDNREVSVQFDVLMREDSSAEPAWVHEVWHFIRSKYSKQPTWFLDGIQQIETDMWQSAS